MFVLFVISLLARMSVYDIDPNDLLQSEVVYELRIRRFEVKSSSRLSYQGFGPS